MKEIETSTETDEYTDYTFRLAQKYSIDYARLRDVVKQVADNLQPLIKKISISDTQYEVSRLGCGPLTTQYGDFHHLMFAVSDQWKTYHAIAKATLNPHNMLINFDSTMPIYLRIDSGCTTGQLFHDRTCDCKEQLEFALRRLGKSDQGIIINIPEQDGRGKGTSFKLATLYLQETLKINTVEAFALIEKSHQISSLDARTYEGAVAVLKFLQAPQNILMGTNNPFKLEALVRNNYNVHPEHVYITPTEHTARHLEAKKATLGHVYGDSK